MRIAVSGVECIFYPFNIEPFGIVHQYHIETARRETSSPGQVILRGADQAPLFVPVYAARSAPVIRAAALPYFDENQRVAVLHDQVNLAEVVVVVFLQQR